MNTPLNPDSVHAPLGKYSHTMKVPAGAVWLVVAGQVGVDPAGNLVEGFRGQSAQAFRNILACLDAQGMGREDLVKLVVYLTDPRGIEEYRAARQEVIGDDVLPPSTLLIIDGLAQPGMLVEIEAWAAKG